MVAAPQYSTMTFVGLRTRKTYPIDVYLSDVNGALINFDGGAGASATSPQSWTPPEPVVLVDFAIVTGMTDTTKLQPTRGGATMGIMLRYALHLSTLAQRPKLALGFAPGIDISAIQRT